jgi:hypothetical protein
VSAHRLVAGLLLLLGGCADAPVEYAHLEPNGELRAGAYANAAAPPGAGALQRAAQITAVLSASGAGGLVALAPEAGDGLATAVPADAGAVVLALDARDLVRPREVVFRWWWGEKLRSETVGWLTPDGEAGPSASVPVDSHHLGVWRVQVVDLSADPASPAVLVERTFEVVKTSSH